MVTIKTWYPTITVGETLEQQNGNGEIDFIPWTNKAARKTEQLTINKEDIFSYKELPFL